MKYIVRRIFVPVLVAPLLWSHLSGAQLINFSGSYGNINGTISEDPTKPVSSGRSYFTTEIVPIDDTKAKLVVHLRHGDLNAPVSLSLQAAINSAVPGAVDPVQPIHIDLISDRVSDNPSLYYSRREFILDYADLTQKLRANLGPKAQHITIGPGTALFVYGHWTSYNHSWGSVGRGGLFYLPESNSATNSSQTIAAGGRAQSLDIAYPITNIMGLQYNTMEVARQKGLKVGGNIASRLEMEGKYQVPLDQADQVLRTLFDLANDPSKAASILGPDWTMETEMRYMKKDAQGNFLKDAQGFPIPDPMVDTYYDSIDSAGAKKDFAFRYRWTEGNQTGGWNFKPGMTEVRPSGVVYRLEYAVDTTDDRPETIKRFADSDSPLSPFRELRNQFAGTRPSAFLNQALRISDQRYKFKVKNRSGLVVEVSLDFVEAVSLRNGRKVHFVQLEMDVDHPSTSRSNIARGLNEYAGLTLKMDYSMQKFGASLGPDAFLDGRPVIHVLDDVKAESPIQQKFMSDFAMAEAMIVALRDHTLGANWLMAPQKASMAAKALNHIRNVSPSVRRLFEQAKAKGISTAKLFKSASGQMMCKAVHRN